MAKKKKKKNAAQQPFETNPPSSKAVSEESSSSSSTFPPHVVAAISPRKYQPPAPPDVVALHPGSVYLSRNFLSKSECDAWVQHAESSVGFEAVSHPATRFVAHRECGRIQRTDWTVADRLYARMGPVVDEVAKRVGVTHSDPTYAPVGCNGNIRLYKYERGMSFGRHYDGSDPMPRFGPSGHTEITVLIYLSSCAGGATRFYPPHSTGSKKKRKGAVAKDEARDGIAYVPEVGSVLLHAHGDRCLEHEADPVLQGVKYVLRTDVVYGTSGSGASLAEGGGETGATL